MNRKQEMKKCIEDCRECHDVCQETLTHCLEQGGRHAESSHVTTLLACAEICATSANFMTWQIDLHPQVCGVCAEMCERCAASCDGIGDDETMRRCAEVCRRCAQSCESMAGAAAASH